MEDEDFFTTGYTTGDLWSLWSSGDELYQGADYGEEALAYDPFFGMDSPRSIEPEYFNQTQEQFELEDDFAQDAPTFMTYNPDTESFESVVTEDSDDITYYGEQLARIASTIGQLASKGALDPIFGGRRDERARDRFRAVQPGDIPRPFGQSGARVTGTRFEAITRGNLRDVYGAIRRTGIDVPSIQLANIPRPSPVRIPEGSIGTTSGRRRAYSKLS